MYVISMKIRNCKRQPILGVRRKNEKQKLNNEFNNIFTYKEERQ